MEYLEVKGICLSIYSDEVAGFSYMRFLTSYSVLGIKLPRERSKFKYNNLLRPDYLLHITCSKRTKNWILTDIVRYHHISNNTSFQSFLKHSELVTIMNHHIKPEQEVEILSWFIEYVSEGVESINTATFERVLLDKLGFGGVGPQMHA